MRERQRPPEKVKSKFERWTEGPNTILWLYLYLANPAAAHREIIADRKINSQPIIILILPYFCFYVIFPIISSLNNLSPAFNTQLHPLGGLS